MPQTVLSVGFQDPALQLDAVWESHANLTLPLAFQIGP